MHMHTHAHIHMCTHTHTHTQHTHAHTHTHIDFINKSNFNKSGVHQHVPGVSLLIMHTYNILLNNAHLLC